MKRAGVIAGAAVMAAIWGVLSQSVSLASTTLLFGVFASLGDVGSPRKVLRDTAFISLWAAVVHLYIRFQWGKSW